MKQRHRLALGLAVSLGALMFSIPAHAARLGRAAPKSPSVSVSWVFGPSIPFGVGGLGATRWDGELYAPQKRVYFLGFRNNDNTTDGSVWYYDLVAGTFVDTGVDMPVPVTNYLISPLKDFTGATGFYIFGGRDGLGAIVDTVQVYYPATNTTATISTDPWPGKTPSNCISLPGTGVATVANHALVIGGASFASSVPACVDDNSNQTWVYFPTKPAGTRWKKGPNLNLARGYITAAVLGNTVYAIGGDVNTAGTLTAQPTVEKWTLGAGGWDDAGAADLPLSPGCDESQAFPFASGALANDIFLAGCGQWPSALPDTWVYNATSNTWTDAGVLNETRRNQAGVLLGSKMFVLGGYATDGFTALSSTEFGTGSPSPAMSRSAPLAPAGSAKATTN